MFTVHPDELKNLDGLQLVELLRILVHAEARKSDIPMRNVDVPLQITVADGGRDATVRWQGGKASTDYFPCRDIVFQCKASDGGDAAWTKEVWTKASQRKKKKRELNPAVAAMLATGGAYVGVTTTALVGTKPDERTEAIRKGIREAGGDPAKLASVQLYDGNKLAMWATSHPAVALWVKERQAGYALSGFATLDQWGRRADISTPPYVGSQARRFALSADTFDELGFDQLSARVVDHISEPGAVVRLWGPSGIGKTRALHHALSTSTGALREIAAANFIFCDYAEVSGEVWKVANQIKNAGLPAVLVVDSCPWEDAKRLNQLARAEDSELRVITLGADGQDQVEDCLMIRPLKADRDTIRGILAYAIKARGDEIDFVAAQCDGFPRIAVLAARAFGSAVSIGKSTNEVAQQILTAAGLGEETVRALELLSLFDHLEPDADPERFDRLAELLVHMKGELTYEHLVRAAEQHLVECSHGRMTAQPLPIANYLALRRFAYLRPSTIIAFLANAEPNYLNAMLARWSAFRERSNTLAEVVRRVVNSSWLSDEATLLGPAAAPYLAAFVHAEPDAMMGALHRALILTSLDDLAGLNITQELLGALRLLAARSSTFRQTAALMLRLTAVTDYSDSSPVVQLLRQLYQVALAGTEADDKHRRESLLKALEEDDPRIHRAVVEALGAMLTTHMTRLGDFDQIAGEDYRTEWSPKTHEVAVDYFRWALERLHELWRGNPDFRDRIETIVASDLRTLLDFDLLDVVEPFVGDVVTARGHWGQATKSIGNWLYFDRPVEDDDGSRRIRQLYDATLPTNNVDLALLYSRFWATDLHNPDKRYAADGINDDDHEYSGRATQALAKAIAKDPDQLDRAVAAFASQELNAPWPFAQTLAQEVENPLAVFTAAIKALDTSGTRAGVQFVRALLGSFDRRLTGDAGLKKRLVTLAEGSATLSERPMDIYSALEMTDARVSDIAEQVRAGTVDVGSVVPISYGRGLAGVSVPAIAQLIAALVGRTKDGGAWAAIEILNMVIHGMKSVAPDLAALCAQALLSPAIAEGSAIHPSLAEHGFDRLIKLLGTSGGIDGAFGTGFAQLIERSCRSVGGYHNRPTEALRTGLPIVVKHAPLEVWAVLAGFYDVATRAERERLNTITAATKMFAFNNGDRTGAGTLFSVPEPAILDWVSGDPANRVAYPISFYPILGQDGESWHWHPATEKLADLYGTLKPFRVALRARILPSSYGGSLEEHLRRFLEPLEAWSTHPMLGNWATSLLGDLKYWLDDEIRRR
jgi:hypothetical protein